MSEVLPGWGICVIKDSNMILESLMYGKSPLPYSILIHRPLVRKALSFLSMIFLEDVISGMDHKAKLTQSVRAFDQNFELNTQKVIVTQN
jgi:hypothetical protein